MAPRHRQRQDSVYGYSTWEGVPGGDTRTCQSLFESMDDTVEKRGTAYNDHALFHEIVRIEGSFINGSASTGCKRGYHNYPSLFYTNSYPYMSGLPETNDAAWTRFIAGTAPHRQTFLAPAFLAELKDVPRLIHYGAGCANFLRELVNNPRRMGQLGRIVGSNQGISPEYLVNEYRPTLGNALSKSKKLGQANLALRFGVAPFVSDLKTALDFVTAVDKRRQELDRLHSKGGLSRGWELGNKEDTYTNFNNQLHAVTGAKVDVVVQRQVRRWGTMRYFPKDRSSLPMKDDELFRQLTGFTVGGALLGIYEATPWSWLLDYYSSLGDHLAATVNTVLVTGSGCLMQEFKTLVSHGSTSAPATSSCNWSLSPGTMVRRLRHRTVRTTATNVSYSGDELTSSQLSILGSLASTKVFS